MRRLMFSVVLLALLHASAFAQPAVFFDDFDGDALLPHWNPPPPSYWEYNVSNSMLNVTGVNWPSHPKSSGIYTSITAPFAAQSDFRMDAWMGWELGDMPHRLEVRVLGPFGGGNPIIARMGYSDEGFPVPQIYASAGNSGTLYMPAPAPGIYHFTITRTGSIFNLYLNDVQMLSVQDNFGTPAAFIGFFFLGPISGEFGAFHIDRVQVVPIPATLILLLVFPFASTRSRR